MKKAPEKILIAGAGVMGLTVAYALKRRFPAALITVIGHTAHSASLMAGGMLAPFSEIEHLPEHYTPAALHGMDFWESLQHSKIGFLKSGSLLLAHPGDEHMLDRFAQKISGHDVVQQMDASGIQNLEPSISKKFNRGMFIQNESCVHPARALGYLADETGPIANRDCDIEIEQAKNDFVIDCRGYGAANNDPDLRGVKGETIILRNKEFILNRPVRLMHPRYPIYIVPRPAHEFMIGATIIESADERVTVKGTMELLSAAYSLHPSFGEAELIEAKAGIRPAYPDNFPRVTVKGNVIGCNGLFRHGYLLAPVMAECVADTIAGKDNEFSHLFMRNHEHHNQRNENRYNRA
jgi:glycine oxidase